MKLLIASLFSFALAPVAACGVDSPSPGELTAADLAPDDVDGHRLLDLGVRLFVDADHARSFAEDAGREIDRQVAELGALAAVSSVHGHTVDWSATRPTHPYGFECPPAGPVIYQGTAFTMYNSGAAWSCAGEWMVQGRLTWEFNNGYRFIKIRALNGH